MDTDKGREFRMHERREYGINIEFFVDADIMIAKTIDISKTGLQFKVDEPMKIAMRMEIEGDLHEYEAQLVWARRKPDGSMSYGFEYVPLPDDIRF